MTTNPPPYTLPDGSLADRVLAFFTRNPDDELSRGDVALKFDVPAEDVERLLKPLVQDQFLAHSLNETRRRVYTAGPVLRLKHQEQATAQPVAPSAPETKPAAKPAARRPRQIVKFLSVDFDALKVEYDVPMPGRLGADKWSPLFEKLDAVGASIEIPAEWASAVQAAALKRNAAARKAGDPTVYQVRRTSATRARVGRTA